MTRLLLCWCLVCSLGIFTRLAGQTTPAYKQVVKLMGCRFELTAIAQTDTLAWKAVQLGIAEIERIERLISSWDENSQTSAINRNAGIAPVWVDQELFNLIVRAQKIAQLTQGAFDISFASMDKIWRFDGSLTALPDEAEIMEARQFINWKAIDMDAEAQTIFLPQAGMKIGFGAIGKGYAANRAKALMQDTPGVVGGLVNASGDLISWGQAPTADGWTIKIADPRQKDQMLAWLRIDNLAVVTSGDYERYLEFEGKRYAHIIDPRTGYPTTGIKSVSVICPDAELADALATSVFVLGTSAGLDLINKLNNIECLIVTDEDELLQSDGLQLNTF
jgi:thiamine biosynthesis lipoprotein